MGRCGEAEGKEVVLRQARGSLLKDAGQGHGDRNRKNCLEGDMGRSDLVMTVLSPRCAVTAASTKWTSPTWRQP